MIKKYFSLFALLFITATGTRAEVVESGTIGSVLFTLDDEGTMSVSGSGELLLSDKVTGYYWDRLPYVKKIVFAEDCTISKICYHALSYNLYSGQNIPLTDIVINTTVPLEIETQAFKYNPSTPVNGSNFNFGPTKKGVYILNGKKVLVK